MGNTNNYSYKEAMFFFKDDYKKLKILENQAYSIHRDYLTRKGKSLDEVIRSSKAYTDFLSSFKIRHLKTGDKMSNETKTIITKPNNVPNYISPIEKFSTRNNIVKKDTNKELRNIRLFTIGVIVCFIGAGIVLHKYGNKEPQIGRYFYLKH
jgi:hypothetical protein